MANPMQDDPRAYWNEQAGPRWVACQEMLDRVMAPVSESLLGTAAIQPGERVFDIGCGAGTLAFAAADRVGAAGRVTGVDVSRPLVEHARARLAAHAGYPQTSFVLADAQTHAFSGRAQVALSRFGVMFFADSAAAFANIRGALDDDGRCVFAVWQGIERNPWITWAVASIADMLPEPPAPYGNDDAPGPFRFADTQRMTSVLQAAGFGEVELKGVDQPLCMAGESDEILQLVQQVGPLSRVLAELAPAAAEQALARVRERIGQLHDGAGVHQPAAWWIVRARVAAASDR